MTAEHTQMSDEHSDEHAHASTQHYGRLLLPLPTSARNTMATFMGSYRFCCMTFRHRWPRRVLSPRR